MQTKILLLVKLGNFSQNLSTTNFNKCSKFNKFYNKPNRFEVFILGEIAFLSQIFKERKPKFYWNLNKIDLISSVSS